MCVSAKFLNACFCNFAACPVGTRHAVSANFSKGTARWKRSTGTFPKSRHYKRPTGRSGLVRSALEKLSLFSPTFPVRQKHGAGISLSADSDSEGCSPSKNTSPAALSWSSLFGQTVLKLFCFRTTRFVFRRKAGTQCAVSAGLPRSFLQKKALPPK